MRSRSTERGVWSCGGTCSKDGLRGLLRDTNYLRKGVLAYAEQLVEKSGYKQGGESGDDDEQDWIDHPALFFAHVLKGPTRLVEKCSGPVLF